MIRTVVLLTPPSLPPSLPPQLTSSQRQAPRKGRGLQDHQNSDTNPSLPLSLPPSLPPSLPSFFPSLQAVNVKLLGRDVGYWTISVWRGGVGVICCLMSYHATARKEGTNPIGGKGGREVVCVKGRGRRDLLSHVLPCHGQEGGD